VSIQLLAVLQKKDAECTAQGRQWQGMRIETKKKQDLSFLKCLPSIEKVIINFGGQCNIDDFEFLSECNNKIEFNNSQENGYNGVSDQTFYYLMNDINNKYFKK
jgi:hypothetical protein